LSLVVATYNRPHLLERLLRQLAVQTLAPAQFEVVVVDDGSAVPAVDALAAFTPPYALRVERQANAGAAAARHRGVEAARGEVIVVVDDDMQVGRDFLEQHLRRHEPGTRRLVLGRMLADLGIGHMPLFERWHAAKLDRMAEDFLSGRTRPRGNHLYTGNVSFRRDDYLATGGFDTTLGCSEDAELGLRLEAAGVEVEFCDAARTVHGSDHASARGWLARAERYGRFDLRIAKKHPAASHADPWRFAFDLSPLSRPFLAATLAAPDATRPLAPAAYGMAALLGLAGWERAAVAGANLAFGLQYFRGLRRETGPLGRVVRAVAGQAWRRMPARDRVELLRRVAREVRADQETLRRYESKYGHASASQGRLASDLVQKIGLQELAAVRVMHALRDGGMPTGARVVSRLVRHLYGSDIHWDAELAPGMMLVHGMGLAISHAAKVSGGCILFQDVTLGMGTDPQTGRTGAPVLERDVHVGPGATLLGPITIGAASKIMAGAVVTRSVPPGSVVLAPEPIVRPREAGRRAAAGA